MSFGQSERYREPKDRFKFFLGAGLAAYGCAVLFTGIGADFSSSLPHSVASATFAIIPIYFSTVFAGERGRPEHLLCGLGAAILSPLLHPVLPTLGGVLVPLLGGLGFVSLTGKETRS